MEPGKLMKTWRHNESVIQGDSAYDIWPGELHRMSCILDDLDAEKCWKMLKDAERLKKITFFISLYNHVEEHV